MHFIAESGAEESPADKDEYQGSKEADDVGRRRRVSLLDNEEFIALWAARGMRDADIAGHLGSTAASIRAFRARQGIKQKKRGREKREEHLLRANLLHGGEGEPGLGVEIDSSAAARVIEALGIREPRISGRPESTSPMYPLDVYIGESRIILRYPGE